MNTILITGANTGIGRACAEQLAAPGVRLILACRSRERTQPVLAELERRGAVAEFLPLDLGDLAGAAAAARSFARANRSLDVLINNAGLAGARGLTSAGYELAFGTNHLGHFAFTLPLLPLLEEARGRIVNVSSGSHYRAPGINFEQLRTPTRTKTGLREYGVSKLCNILFTAELRRRHPQLTAVSVHPGRIASDVWRNVPAFFRPVLRWALRMESVHAGGAAVVHAAQALAPKEGGELPLYFHVQQPRPPSRAALREDLAAELWRFSLDAVADRSEVPLASEPLRPYAATT